MPTRAPRGHHHQRAATSSPGTTPHADPHANAAWMQQYHSKGLRASARRVHADLPEASSTHHHQPAAATGRTPYFFMRLQLYAMYTL